jgi:phospholipid/cholesterol/gamma-HCH transport system ATP-binding protein
MSEAIVSLRKVSVSFERKRVLHNVNLEMQSGETTCLLGTSGCGKTTTLRVIAGLQRFESGEATLFGEKILPETPEKNIVPLRRRLGVVFQNGALFDSMTVGQNIGFPLQYCKGITETERIERSVSEMLQHVELGDIGGMFPAELSGGMRKRVAIARALIHEPEVLLLDEPTTGLDPVTARHIDKLLYDLGHKFKVAVLVVTHDLVSALGIGDNLILMESGGIAWEGSRQELVSSRDRPVRRFAWGLHSIREESHP